MIDNHAKCEWVNVSSGTGLPGNYRTKCCKTVFVVVVIIITCL